jgi:hypothetical protein
MNGIEEWLNDWVNKIRVHRLNSCLTTNGVFYIDLVKVDDNGKKLLNLNYTDTYNICFIKNNIRIK